MLLLLFALLKLEPKWLLSKFTPLPLSLPGTMLALSLIWKGSCSVAITRFAPLPVPWLIELGVIIGLFAVFIRESFTERVSLLSLVAFKSMIGFFCGGAVSEKSKLAAICDASCAEAPYLIETFRSPPMEITLLFEYISWDSSLLRMNLILGPEHTELG